MRYKTTEQLVRSAALPKATATYQPIGHGQMLDWVNRAAKERGLRRVSLDIMSTDRKDIPAAQMVAEFAFQPSDKTLKGSDLQYQVVVMNSYDKSMRASVASGARVFVCANGMIISENLIRRRHQGRDAKRTIKEHIQSVMDDQALIMRSAVEQREALMGETLSFREMAELAGVLYVQERMLSSWEMSELVKQIEKPSFDYGGNNDTAWEFYNHVTHALKMAPPGQYTEKHRSLNQFMADEFIG